VAIPSPLTVRQHKFELLAMADNDNGNGDADTALRVGLSAGV